MLDPRSSTPVKRPPRLPWRVERELAKLLSTLGFSAYGSALWSLSEQAERDRATRVDALSPGLSAQIEAQALHDPSLLAAGQLAVPHLPQTIRRTRVLWGADTRTLFAASGERPDVMFLVPSLQSQQAEKVRAMIPAFQDLGARSFLVVVTDGHKERSESVGGARVVHWLDHCSGRSATHPRVLALFIHAAGPSKIVVLGSRLGFETVARYGRALGRFHQFFCALQVPAAERSVAFKDVHHFRSLAPHATMLAESEEAARVLRQHGEGLDGPGIEIVPADGFLCDAARRVRGQDFSDHRSPTGRKAIETLKLPNRTGAAAEAPALSPALAVSKREDFDITVTIVFHREMALAVPALASLADMISVAKRAGLRVESRAVLDRPDDVTSRLIRSHGGFLGDVQEVSVGEVSLARNFGTERARGRYLAFLDGDDLWGADWLKRAYDAAAADGSPTTAVWHPTYIYLFFGSDCDSHSATNVPQPTAASRHLKQPSSVDGDFVPTDLLLENLWSANAFAAAEVFRQIPYRPNHVEHQTGIEDWRWNLETLGSGIRHLVVPETIHLIRQKETGSLGQSSDLQGLLPILD